MGAVMSDKFVLVVSDNSDSKHGEISVLNTAQQTERLVETLLDAGFDQERIRVFTGSEAEFAITYRPVVSLADEPNQTTKPALPASDHVEPEATDIEAETEGEAVEAHSGNGHSMSSLFRSARDEKGVIFASVQSPKVAIDRDVDTSAGAAMHRGRLRGLAPRRMRDAKL